jgi:hypothetical protein
VAVYFSVDTLEGKPVADLTSDKFTIYEDGSKVSPDESKQTVLDSKLGSSRYTLLLIGVNGGASAAKQVGEVVKAATAFSERMKTSQNVAIYAFDGGPDLYPIVPFAASDSGATGGLTRLASFKPKGSSTNLTGAVVLGMKLLSEALAADPKAIKLGTLVVFAGGSDHTNRVSQADVRAALRSQENAKLDVFTVGVGADVNVGRLREIGRTGSVVEPDSSNLSSAFDAAATKMEARAGRYYLLSYCSPARGGSHSVRVEAHTPTGLTGELTYRFSAEGFEAGCDPETPPSFLAEHPAAPPPQADKKKDAPKKPAPAPKKRPAPTPPSDSPPPTARPAAPPPPPPGDEPFAP